MLTESKVRRRRHLPGDQHVIGLSLAGAPATARSLSDHPVERDPTRLRRLRWRVRISARRDSLIELLCRCIVLNACRQT